MIGLTVSCAILLGGGHADAVDPATPDLAVTAVIAPPELRIGETVDSVSAQIENVGLVSATSFVSFYISSDATIDYGDTWIGYSYATLEPGQSTAVTPWDLSVPDYLSAGDYYIGALIESDVNPANNTVSRPLRLLLNARDLAVTALNAPSEATTEELILSMSAQIENKGPVSASSYVSFFISSDPSIEGFFGDTWIGYGYASLEPGQSATLIPEKIFMPDSVLEGDFYIGALIERNDMHLTNNSLSQPIHLNPPAPTLNPANGHYYQIFRHSFSWEEAAAAAESMTHKGMPGHLVTLTSPAESEFLSSISRFTQYWIGGYQDKTAPDYSEPSGGWRWVTGEPFLYTNWDGPEPNEWQALEDYIMTWTDWRWNDNYNGSNIWGFAVEFEPVSPAPTLNPANGHHYQIFRHSYITWEEAAAAAESMTYEGMPGHLVTLTSPGESEFLSSISRFTQYWIGGYQNKTASDYSEPSGGWRWVTGEPFLYTNWDGPEPNEWQSLEDYIMTWTDWRWNDNYNGSNIWGYAVEFEPVSELLGGLISRLEGWSLKKGTAQSLIVKLRQAREKLEAGDTKTAMNILSAFGSEVQAQKGKQLTPAQADQLTHQINRFLDVLSLLPKR